MVTVIKGKKLQFLPKHIHTRATTTMKKSFLKSCSLVSQGLVTAVTERVKSEWKGRSMKHAPLSPDLWPRIKVRVRRARTSCPRAECGADERGSPTARNQRPCWEQRLPCVLCHAPRVSPKEWGCLGSSWWAFSLTRAAVGLMNIVTSVSSMIPHISVVKAGIGLKC